MLVLLQSMAGEVMFTHNNMPSFVALVKERPGLMAFYGRLKAKVFPNGPSENWATGCWDPKKHASVAC